MDGRGEIVLARYLDWHPEAAAIAIKVVAVRRKVLGEMHFLYALSVFNLAAQYHGMGEHGKALPLYLEARDLFRKAPGKKQNEQPDSQMATDDQQDQGNDNVHQYLPSNAAAATRAVGAPCAWTS